MSLSYMRFLKSFEQLFKNTNEKEKKHCIIFLFDKSVAVNLGNSR